MQITEELIREAYEETGLELKRGKFISDDGKSACALGALYVYFNGDIPVDKGIKVSSWAIKELGIKSPMGFGTAFDEGTKGREVDLNSVDNRDEIKFANNLGLEFHKNPIRQEELIYV